MLLRHPLDDDLRILEELAEPLALHAAHINRAAVLSSAYLLGDPRGSTATTTLAGSRSAPRLSCSRSLPSSSQRSSGRG